MKPRERYLSAVNLQTVDRPPFDLMGTACGLTNKVFQELKDKLGVTTEDRQFRSGQDVSLYNEDVLEALNIDARRVWMRELPEFYINDTCEKFVDEWGVPYEICGNHVQQAGSPLEGAKIEDIENYDFWPDMSDERRINGLQEEAKKLKENTDYAIIGRCPTAGFFERSCWLRGMQQYMMDMALDPDFVEVLNEKVCSLQIELYESYLDACGKFLDVVETADDYGSARGPMVSPDMFRTFLKPWRTKINQAIKKKAPHIKIFHHTCGNVQPLIPDLIDCGIDILNPAQPVEGMEPEVLAEKFGKDICFHGAVDTIAALRGDAEDVKKEICKLRYDFRDCGWILAPANHIQDDIPVENILAMFEGPMEEAGPGGTVR